MLWKVTMNVHKSDEEKRILEKIKDVLNYTPNIFEMKPIKNR